MKRQINVQRSYFFFFELSVQNMICVRKWQRRGGRGSVGGGEERGRGRKEKEEVMREEKIEEEEKEKQRMRRRKGDGVGEGGRVFWLDLFGRFVLYNFQRKFIVQKILKGFGLFFSKELVEFLRQRSLSKVIKWLYLFVCLCYSIYRFCIVLWF